MSTSDNTAQRMVQVPDKVWLVFLAIFTSAIGIVVSYMVILHTQDTLLQNDIRIQNQVDENSKVIQQQNLNINTLTVKMDALADRESGDSGP